MLKKVDCGFFVFWVNENNIVHTLSPKDIASLQHAQDLVFIRAKTLCNIENVFVQPCACMKRCKRNLAETHLYIE